ncbi:hypothetical protein QZH41_011587, partial [Actinostola sp. cb2023]
LICNSVLVWQHPYVNVLKHFGIGEWKKCTKEGDISPLMDKQVKGTIYRISGSIPAGNYVQFPRTTSQTLGLTGRYLYLMFKPIQTKYFVVHIDVAANDGSAVRISFSNLFKEFKSTSTWLQFPFVSNPSPTSVEAKTSSEIQIANLVGTTPQTSRWTLLVLDLHYILSAYLNLSFAYVKNARLCANMFLRGLFTSDVDYQPGLTSSEARKLGLIAEGVTPMPKEMAFPIPKGSDWQTLYDYVRFPPDKNNTRLGIITSLKGKRMQSHESRNKSARKSEKDSSDVVKSKGHAHVSTGHHEIKSTTEPDIIHEPVSDRHVYATINRPSIRQKVPSKLKSLKPDPILSLKKIVGFGGGTYKDGLWNINGTCIVYPCHAIIVSMDISSGKQEFLVGHTDKISALAFDGSANILGSAQIGKPSLIRLWKYDNRKCAALFRTQVFDIHCISLSYNGNILCAVGQDSAGKQLVVVWDTSQAMRGGQVNLLAKAHTDVHINRMRIADFDDSRMVSCGKENIRFWRLRNGSLRSCPLELRQHAMTEFTDITYGIKERASTTPTKIYCSTTAGSIFQVDYNRIIIDQVFKLLPIGGNHGNNQVSINVLVVNELFCVTGSSDGYLRLWSNDFSKVSLEAEHEGSVTIVNVSRDGRHILAGTNMGNLGILNTITRSYQTVMRSHTDVIHALSMDTAHRRLGTVSADHTIRIWDMDTLSQLYDFQAPEEEPCVIVFHPLNTMFACGFTDGTVRVFDILTTNLVTEHKQHRGRVTGLVFAPNGAFLFSSGSLGALAMYSANNNDYELVRMLLDMTPRNKDMGPCALSISHDSRKLAFIGPSEYTVCVVDARSLDEVLRVDITTVLTTPGHIDTAVLVSFSAPDLNQLLVMTSSNRLLKLNASNGLLLSEISNVHRRSCTCLETSSNGRYLATGGDNLIKIWDYHMRLDINFQVFIGHSDPIHQVLFTPGNHEVISAGEAILIWDFHGRTFTPPKPCSTDVIDSSIQKHKGETPQMTSRYPVMLPNTSQPRGNPPKPTIYEPIELDLSPVRDTSQDVIDADTPEIIRVETEVSFQESPKRTEHSINQEPTTTHSPPNVCRHFKKRANKTSVLAKCRYTAPPNQAGLTLKSVLGYNGEGRKNIIWKYDTGLFAYSSGAIIVIEDLHSGVQRHLIGHIEDVSTMTVQNDGLVLASASGSSPSTSSQICIWKVKDGSCEKMHEPDVPGDMFTTKADEQSGHFTSVCYAADGILYTATSDAFFTSMCSYIQVVRLSYLVFVGLVFAWDTQQNKCFIHWKADSAEIVDEQSRHYFILPRINSESLVMDDEMTMDGAVISASFDDVLQTGIIGTTMGTLWYVNWSERTSIRLVSGHTQEVCVLGVNGYGDGTVRMFDLGRVEMIMKMQPHGRVIISGASDGIIAISSPSTGLTVRLLNDHKGAPITDLHSTLRVSSVHYLNDHKGAPITDLHSTLRDNQYSVSGPMLWLAASKDSRVSIWSAKWSQDFCELVDWLSFPTPSIAPDGRALRRGDLGQYDRLPPSLARFSPSDADIIIFTGYSMQRAVHFYSLSQRKIVRTAALTHWATSMDVSPKGNLIALGTQERLVQMMDYDEGRFQDFVGHSDAVTKVCFSPSGKLLYTASYLTLLAWTVVV